MQSLAVAAAVFLLSAGALLNGLAVAYFLARCLRAYPRHSRPRKPAAQAALAPAHR